MSHRLSVPVREHSLEYVCKHCGAPRDVYLVSKERFEAVAGKVVNGFVEHNDWEIDYPEEQVSAVRHFKLVDSVCKDCSGRER